LVSGSMSSCTRLGFWLDKWEASLLAGRINVTPKEADHSIGVSDATIQQMATALIVDSAPLTCWEAMDLIAASMLWSQQRKHRTTTESPAFLEFVWWQQHPTVGVHEGEEHVEFCCHIVVFAIDALHECCCLAGGGCTSL